MATLANALQYLENEKTPVWKLEKSAGTKVSEYIGESVEDAKESLQNLCALLSPGKYRIRCRKSEHANRGESVFEFALSGAESGVPTAVPPTAPAFGDFMQMFQFCFAQAQASAQIQIDSARKEYEFQRELADVKAALKKLTDGDPDNDKGALDTLTEKAPAILKTFKLFRDELTTKPA